VSDNLDELRRLSAQANDDLAREAARLKDAAMRLANAPARHDTDLRMEARIVANAATDYSSQYVVAKTYALALRVAGGEK
jgi:hypothetical protein